METWKIIATVAIIVLIAAPIIGAIIGKQMAKRKNNPRKSVLDHKQKVVSTISIILGVACIATGFLLPKTSSTEESTGEIEQGEGEGGTPFTGDAGGQVVEFETATGGGAVIMG